MAGMPVIERNLARLHYRVSGEGPAVILQHPLIFDQRAFEANGLRKQLVAEGYRCITPDAIGHGKSDLPPEPARYSLEEQVADVLRIADAAGAERFAWIGYSMGAWLGSGVLAAAPERLTVAVLAGWDLIAGARAFTSMRTPADRRREFAERIPEIAAQGGMQLQPERLVALVNCYLHLFGPLPGLEQLARSRVPTYILCGAGDPYFANAQHAASVLGGPFVALPGDHMAAFTAPQLVQTAIEALHLHMPLRQRINR